MKPTKLNIDTDPINIGRPGKVKYLLLVWPTKFNIGPDLINLGGPGKVWYLMFVGPGFQPGFWDH